MRPSKPTPPTPPVADATAATAPRKKPARAAPLQADRPWHSDQTDPPDNRGSSASPAQAEQTGRRSAQRQKEQSQAALDNVSKGYD